MDKKMLILIFTLISVIILFVLFIYFIFSRGKNRVDDGEEIESDDKSNDDKSNDDKSNDDKSNDDKSNDDKSNDDKSNDDSNIVPIHQPVLDIYNVASVDYTTQNPVGYVDRSGANVLTNDGVWWSHDYTYEDDSNAVTKGSYASWLLIDNKRIYGQYVIINLSSPIKYTKFYLNNQINDNSPKDFLIIGKKNISYTWKHIQQSDGRDGGKIKYYNDIGKQDSYDSYGIIVTKSQANSRSVTVQNLFFINGSRLTPRLISNTGYWKNSAPSVNGHVIIWQSAEGTVPTTESISDKNFIIYSADGQKGYGHSIKFSFQTKLVISRFEVNAKPSAGNGPARPKSLSLYGSNEENPKFFVPIVLRKEIGTVNTGISISTLYMFKYYVFQVHCSHGKGFFTCQTQFYS